MTCRSIVDIGSIFPKLSPGWLIILDLFLNVLNQQGETIKCYSRFIG